MRATEVKVATEDAGLDHFPACIYAVDDVCGDEGGVDAVLLETGYFIADG